MNRLPSVAFRVTAAAIILLLGANRFQAQKQAPAQSSSPSSQAM